MYILRGHTSTIRCIRMLHNRPIAVSGSRDGTLRVWDIQKGRMLRGLLGREESVRCLDVFGNKVVSGSYDFTCRVSLSIFLLQHGEIWLLILEFGFSCGMLILDSVCMFYAGTSIRYILLHMTVFISHRVGWILWCGFGIQKLGTH